MKDLRARLDTLYNGDSPHSTRFRYALLAVDLVTIGFFLATSFLDDKPGWTLAVDYLIAVVLAADFIARLIIEPRTHRFLLDPVTIADAVVIASLVAAPWIENVAFLRVLRSLRLIRSYHVVREIRRNVRFFRVNERVINAVLNLMIFIFVVGAVVYVVQVHRNPQIENYVDALYFTVTTLTTTGFGDIILVGSLGRLLSILVMVFGVGLFLRMLQEIFRPLKVDYRCPDCGLRQHDPDAVHCKHCGRTLNIETEGA